MRSHDLVVASVICCAASLVADLIPSRMEAQQPRLSAPAIKYVKRGAPVRRVSAGVRGHAPVALNRQAVALLAPHDHVGWTMLPQPTLFWRYHGRLDAVASATLILRNGSRVDSIALPLPDSGLQRIDLASHRITLQRDVDHKWMVVVLRRDRSLAPETDEVWLRVVGSNTLSTEPHDPMELARAAAAVGLWYDAFAALTDLYAADPSDRAIADAWSGFVTRTVVGLKPPSLGSLGATR